MSAWKCGIDVPQHPPRMGTLWVWCSSAMSADHDFSGSAFVELEPSRLVTSRLEPFA